MEKKFTYCRICEGTCGFVAEVENNRIIHYAPDKEHPVSKGYCCIKGREILSKLYHPKRLKYPMKQVNGRFTRISWAQAIDEIGGELSSLKDKYGPHSIGSYFGNPPAFSYSSILYFGGFNKFLGSRNLFGPGSQDCNNRFANSERLYGAPLTLPVPDVDRIDYFLALGTNPLASHFSFMVMPDPARCLKKMQKRGCKITWINPRKTEAAKITGKHLHIRPNTDIYFLFGIIHHILENNLEDREFIDKHTKGFEQLRGLAAEFGKDLDKIYAITGISRNDIITIATEFAEASKKGGASAYGRVGTDRGPFATLKAWAIDVLNIITGNLDQKGNFYTLGLTSMAKVIEADQPPPNAQEFKSRIGNFPQVMGTLPAAIMADEILTPGDGQIRGMINFSGDPLISCPNAKRLEKAFKTLDIMVSFDAFINDTGILSDYILPTTLFLEREDFSCFTSSYNPIPFVNFTRSVVDPDGEQKPEWKIINLLSEKMGLPALGDQPLEIFKMLLNPEDQKHFDALIGSEKGVFMTPDGKLQYNTLLPDKIKFPDHKIPLAPDDYLPEFERLRNWTAKREDDYPFSLISGRQITTINSWLHTRGKTNYCSINTEDAKAMGIEEGTLVKVSTRVGAIEIPAKVTNDLMRGVIWIPHGWGRTIEDVPEEAIEKRGVNVNLITDDNWRNLEPIAGMVMLDGVAVRIERA